MMKWLRFGVFGVALLSLAACGDNASPGGGGAGGTGGTGGTGAVGGTGGTGGTGGAGGTQSCESTCSPGLIRCAGDAIETCADLDRDGCYDWTEPVGCADGYTCSNGVCTDPGACQDECSDGATQCGSVGVQRCERDFDGDPCTDWGPEEPCEDGESCSNGSCSAGPCQDECGEGAARCDGNGRQTCGQFDADDCLEWSITAGCGDNQTCSNGECTSPDECTDECAEGTTACVEGNQSSARCGQYDMDPCLELGEIDRCAEGEFCSNGACSSDCSNECVLGAQRCLGNGFQSCTDVAGCLIWGEPMACGEGEGCVDGLCLDGAVDECPSPDAVRCEGDAILRCGNFDADPALDWSAPQPCPAGETCSNGVCAAGCEDECAEGERSCRAGGVVTCGQFDGDDCLDIGGLMPCEAGQSCNDGACSGIDNCVDECEILGETTCGPDGVRQCGNYDADDCMDWSVGVPCGDNQRCEVGGCVEVVDPNNNDNAALAFFAPQDGATVSGDLVEIRLNASDGDGVQRLVLSAGEQIIAEVAGRDLPGEWFSIRWDSRTVPNGNVTLEAVLTDLNGLEARASRAITVDNGGPVIEIERPIAGRVLGGPFDFTATIRDGGGIQSYAFLVGRRNVAERLDVPAGTDELEHTVNIDPADYEEGPITLTVRARDRNGAESEASVGVEFRSGILIESLEPRIIDGLFPVVARPFDWSVRAEAPAGVASVEFLIDGERLVLDGEPPYTAQIDPALYVDNPSNCARGEHQLGVVVTDRGGQTQSGSWCATWDSTPPEVELVQPAEPGGLIAKQDGSYTLEFAVVDDDPRTTVTINLDDAEIARVDAAPHAVSVDADQFLNNLATHDQELSVEVTATDYLGNSEHLVLPVRVTRADWAVSLPGYRSVMSLQAGDNVVFGLWNATRNQGRMIMLGAEGGARWDVQLRRGQKPVEGFFFPNSSSVGVRCEAPGAGSVFVSIDPDGDRSEFLAGFVAQAVPGNALDAYLSLQPGEQPGELVRLGADGEESYSHDFGAEVIPQRIESIHRLDNGDVLVHTIGIEDPSLNVMRRWNPLGQEVWNYAVGGAVTQSHIDVSGSTIVFGRTDVQGFDQAEVLTRIDMNTGNLVWSWPAPLDVNREASSFRADGAYIWRGRNLHTAQAHAMAMDVETGEQVYRSAPAASAAGGFSPPGYDVERVVNLRAAGDTAISAIRPAAAVVGQPTSAIYRVAVDGRISAVFFGAPTEERGGELIAEYIQELASKNEQVAVTLSVGATGESRLALLNVEMQTIWRMPMPLGSVITRVWPLGNGSVDVVSSFAGEGDSVYPIRTVNGQGAFPWRVHRPQAEIGSFVQTSDALFVTLNGDADVDVLRIPRD